MQWVQCVLHTGCTVNTGDEMGCAKIVQDTVYIFSYYAQ